MELTQELKDLLNAHDLASITDFIDIEHEEDYIYNSQLDSLTIKSICEIYEGWGVSSLEDKIVNILKNTKNK